MKTEAAALLGRCLPPCPAFTSPSIVKALNFTRKRQKHGNLATAKTGQLELHHLSGLEIHIFGMEHLKHQADAAEFVLRHKPAVVVVETALDRDHGIATGNTVGIDDAATTLDISMFQQLGRQLSWESDPLTSTLWQRLKPNCGEQLVYVAAFAVAAKIVYGDQPKHDTYSRLKEFTSLSDLDYAFGIQSWLNYQELLTGRFEQIGPAEKMGVVDRMMLTEREATFCQTLDQVAGTVGTSTGGVIGVLGEAHLHGLKRLWESDEWRAVCSEAGDADSDSNASSSTAFAEPEGLEDPASTSRLSAEEAAGVKQALLESTMRLKSVESVVNDIRQAFPVPEPSWEPYCWTHELYAAPRMLLASLTRDQLARVCSGWRCDMWQVLGPLRAARPVNGGTGLDIDLAISLRELNILFPRPSESEVPAVMLS